MCATQSERLTPSSSVGRASIGASSADRPLQHSQDTVPGYCTRG